MVKTVGETILMVLSYLASLIASTLPIVAFEYTGDWDKVFDCFSPESLISDVFSCLFKLAFFLFALGPEALPKVFDTVTSIYIEVLLAGLGLFLFHTVKKHRAPGQLRISLTAAAVLSFCLGTLASFAVCSFLECKMPWWLIVLIYVCQYLCLVIQNFMPVLIRYAKNEFNDDEPLIFTFKMVATVLAFFTAVVDCVNFRKEQDFRIPTSMLLWLSIITAALNAGQLIIRACGPNNVRNFLNAIGSKIDDICCTIWHHVVCLVEKIYPDPDIPL